MTESAATKYDDAFLIDKLSEGKTEDDKVAIVDRVKNKMTIKDKLSLLETLVAVDAVDVVGA